MYQPITQVEVEAEIHRLVVDLEAETERLLSLGREASQAEVNYKREHAKAFLSADGPVNKREAEADVATSELLLARRISDVTYEACREKCRMIRTALDAYRSINANVRSQTE